ncbi:RluA family pseudouridine synthase [Merdimmobilis hominis]|uniref:RluA family pseudouridine synthase n=1 Tax=Merdimmobilis hominis TaxID=2897707 RepID=UPI0008F8CA4E|nr:RluA family pseudouridine synthase [Merdimmobilis hominis]
MEVLELTVPPEGAGERLDKWISTQVEGVSRSAAQKFCEEGLVEAAGKALSKNYKLRGGEALCLTIPDPVELDVTPEDIPLDIVYEDPSLLVVNKPKGMVVHPAYGNLNHTLVNALLYHCKGQLSGINGVIRPGIVHRIDKDTSGLLVVAKDDQAHSSLAAQIKEHSFDRFYHAVVYGNLKEDSGTVHQPIGRHPTDRKKMAVTDKNSRDAVTHFEVVERYQGFTHVRLKLETGRTHQIRVHMAYIGHPVAGDPVYGPRKVISSLEGQCLHAKTISFLHPKTGELLSFDSPLPGYFTRFLSTLKRR